jgi:hypothetical protein
MNKVYNKALLCESISHTLGRNVTVHIGGGGGGVILARQKGVVINQSAMNFVNFSSDDLNYFAGYTT